jgi:hypothetical protein
MGGTLVSKKLLKLLGEFEKSLSVGIGVEDLKKSSDQEASRVCGELYRVAGVLLDLARDLDPTRPPTGLIELFSPATIGRLVGQELLRVELLPLDDIKPFYGSGIYALYYSGEFSAYRAIKKSDCPIYVGNADPIDRKARIGREQGKGIYGRLAMHRKNIVKANASLNIRDFQCRYLVTESGWQATAEEFLIWLYQPVWNKEMSVCSGFGKHGDVARRERSAWDILHSGRGWAADQTSRRRKTAETIARDIEAHYMGLFKQDPVRWRKLFDREWIREKFNS